MDLPAPYWMHHMYPLGVPPALKCARKAFLSLHKRGYTFILQPRSCSIERIDTRHFEVLHVRCHHCPCALKCAMGICGWKIIQMPGSLYRCCSIGRRLQPDRPRREYRPRSEGKDIGLRHRRPPPGVWDLPRRRIRELKKRRSLGGIPYVRGRHHPIIPSSCDTFGFSDCTARRLLPAERKLDDDGKMQCRRLFAPR